MDKSKVWSIKQSRLEGQRPQAAKREACMIASQHRAQQGREEQGRAGGTGHRAQGTGHRARCTGHGAQGTGQGTAGHSRAQRSAAQHTLSTASQTKDVKNINNGMFRPGKSWSKRGCKTVPGHIWPNGVAAIACIPGSIPDRYRLSGWGTAARYGLLLGSGTGSPV